MEIVDANAGLLSNFEVFQFLSDSQKNNYPPYESYLPALELQKEREFASSFLSARDVAKLAAEEAAEAALAAHETAKDPNAAVVAPPLVSCDGTVFPRDLKPLEGAVWIKSRVLAYLSQTPCATQTYESSATFLAESKTLLRERAGFNRVKEEDTRLTVCELIQLLNLRPASLVEIHRAIEECEERLSEEDTMALLELIERTLPKAPPRAGAAAEGEAEEAAAEDAPQPMETE